MRLRGAQTQFFATGKSGEITNDDEILGLFERETEVSFVISLASVWCKPTMCGATQNVLQVMVKPIARADQFLG